MLFALSCLERCSCPQETALTLRENLVSDFLTSKQEKASTSFNSNALEGDPTEIAAGLTSNSFTCKVMTSAYIKPSRNSS